MSTISTPPGNRRGKKTTFHYAPKKTKKQRILLLVGMLICAAVLVVSLIHVIDYADDHVQIEQQKEDVREAYYDAAAQQQANQPPTAQPGAATVQPVAAVTPAPRQAGKTTYSGGMLPLVHYPNNFNAQVQERFQVLRLRYNGDITAWLKIGTSMDEAVVYRDNTYYLHRDLLGKHNQNGTLFLDQGIDWRTRPYTLMVYGHNMKSGAMFGRLKSFEKHDFFRDHALITFDTAYEDGRYVVFAVGTYSLHNADENYVNLGEMDSRNVKNREKQIQRLMDGALITAPVDVQADDQILLLVTCVDNESERRILAARRIRENETEAELMAAIREGFAH